MQTKQEIYDNLEDLKEYRKEEISHEMSQEDYNILCAEIEMLEWVLKVNI